MKIAAIGPESTPLCANDPEPTCNPVKGDELDDDDAELDEAIAASLRMVSGAGSMVSSVAS